MKITPVILVGGSGTRLWPISREDQPKQFLPLLGSNSLFQNTVDRVVKNKIYNQPLIVGNEKHRFLIQNQLKEIKAESDEIILEPSGRNTAPALTLAVLRMMDSTHGIGDDDVILVLPADHYIGDEIKFGNTIKSAFSLAQSGYIVTFGIKPVHPEIGYGYIKKGNVIKSDSVEGAEKVAKDGNGFENDVSRFEIEDFVEKPNKHTAETFVKSEAYYWNSGIFMMKPSVWINAVNELNKDLFDYCELAVLNGDADGYFYRPNKIEFEKCENIAIDYAVMENIGSSNEMASGSRINTKGCVFELDVQWSDVGSWLSLADVLNINNDSNILKGDVYVDSTTNSIVIANNRMVVTVGIENLVIVETGDAVLISEKHSVQLVKNIVGKLKAENRTEQQKHLKIQRPWGSFEILDQSQEYQVKKLLINPMSAISLQFHEHRSEHWVVVKGQVEVVKGESLFVLKENQSTYVSKGEIHRLLNNSDSVVEIIEVQTGFVIEEKDIVRIKDDYNRHLSS